MKVPYLLAVVDCFTNKYVKSFPKKTDLSETPGKLCTTLYIGFDDNRSLSSQWWTQTNFFRESKKTRIDMSCRHNKGQLKESSSLWFLAIWTYSAGNQIPYSAAVSEPVDYNYNEPNYSPSYWVLASVADPDPVGSVLFGSPGSGSGMELPDPDSLSTKIPL